jgi:hypothetical protein
MLEMSVDYTITLEGHDFDRYVMDNWEWLRFALATNTAYAAEVPSASREREALGDKKGDGPWREPGPRAC